MQIARFSVEVTWTGWSNSPVDVDPRGSTSASGCGTALADSYSDGRRTFADDNFMEKGKNFLFLKTFHRVLWDSLLSREIEFSRRERTQKLCWALYECHFYQLLRCRFCNTEKLIYLLIGKNRMYIPRSKQVMLDWWEKERVTLYTSFWQLAVAKTKLVP